MVEQVAAQKPAARSPEKRVKIILENSSKIPPVGLFVGHNGRAFLIKPGVPVEVPECVLSVLNDSVVSTPIINPETRQVDGYQDAMQYPYRLVN
jgi:hypothetical protein